MVSRVGQNNQIYQVINNLSTDEDVRQELWVHYLTVQSTSNLSQHLEKIKLEHNVDRQVQDLLFNISKSTSNEKLSEIMSKFSDFESQLVILMMLGLSLEEISKNQSWESVLDKVDRAIDILPPMRGEDWSQAGKEKWQSTVNVIRQR